MKWQKHQIRDKRYIYEIISYVYILTIDQYNYIVIKKQLFINFLIFIKKLKTITIIIIIHYLLSMYKYTIKSFTYFYNILRSIGNYYTIYVPLHPQGKNPVSTTAF